MGVGSLVITVAPAIGPTVGGAVSSILPWRAIFVIVIPIVLLISLPVGLKCIEQHRPTEEARLNSLQFVSIVLALCGLVMFLNQAGVSVSAAVSGSSAMVSAVFAVVSLIVGLGALLFFGWSSKRSFSPLIRLGWLHDPMVLLHLIAYMLLPIVGIGFGYVITNVAQLSLGASAFLSGALVLPGALIGAFFAPVGGMLYDRFGPVRPILGAFFAAICGPILLLVFSMRLTPVMLAGFYFIFGLGYSLGFSNIMTNALRNIAPQFMPDAMPCSTPACSLVVPPVQRSFPRFCRWPRPVQAKRAVMRSVMPRRLAEVGRSHDDCHRLYSHLLPDCGVPNRRKT